MKPSAKKLLLPGIFVLLSAALLFAGPVRAGEGADICRPCLDFDHLDKQIRNGALPKVQARQQFAARIADLDAFLAGAGNPSRPSGRWVFPLRGYTLATAGTDAARSYVSAGYDYFDGNHHGGHPSFDLFITDRNQDSLDDRTEEAVTVVSMTDGIVVAAETAWDEHSTLRGGRYLWIYDSISRALIYYAHNRDLLVKVGDRVRPGTPLATVGRSGFNAAKKRSPTHLHLTVLRVANGRPEPDNIYPRLVGAVPSE